jgi:2-phosphoglycerate kinase
MTHSNYTLPYTDDIVFIYVINQGETNQQGPFMFNSYARSHVQSTLQLMGCKQRDADAIANMVFEWLTQAKQIQIYQENIPKVIEDGGLSLVDSDEETQERLTSPSLLIEKPTVQDTDENDADNEEADERESDHEELSNDEWGHRTYTKLGSSYDEPLTPPPSQRKSLFEKIRARIKALSNQQTKWNARKRLTEEDSDHSVKNTPIIEARDDLILKRKMIKELAKILHRNKRKNVAHVKRTSLQLSDIKKNTFYQTHYDRRDIVMLTREQFDELISVALAIYDYSKPSRIEDFRIACQIQERKRSVIILFGGTSGTGKSTLASLIASRMGITKVLSTDSVRHLLRGFVTKEQEPCLFASTYHAGEAIKNEEKYKDYTSEELVIEGYKRQCRVVVEHLDKIITNCENRNEPMVVEGVHLITDYVIELLRKHPTCVIPYIVYISNAQKHKERFAFRARYMTLEPRNNKYVKYFNNIRTIQQFICDRADFYNVPKIDNTNIDKSLATIHSSVFKCVKRSVMHGETVYDAKENKAKVVPPVQYALWSSRRMLNAIRKKRSSLSEHVDTVEQQQQQQQSEVVLEVPTSERPQQQIPVPILASSIPKKLLLQKEQIGEETGSEVSQFADHELSSQSDVSSTRVHFHTNKHIHHVPKKHVPTAEEQFYENAKITVITSKNRKKKKLPDSMTIFESTSEDDDDEEDGSADEASTRPVLELVNTIAGFKDIAISQDTSTNK